MLLSSEKLSLIINKNSTENEMKVFIYEKFRKYKWKRNEAVSLEYMILQMELLKLIVKNPNAPIYQFIQKMNG